MPMEMSSLGPTVGELVGFLEPVKIEQTAKNEGFYEHILRNMSFLMGKSIEHRQWYRTSISIPTCYKMTRHSDFESLKNLTHI